MTEQEFYRIHSYLKKRYGVDMSRKKEIIHGRMENYFRAGGWTSYNEYMNAVESDITGKLEKELVNLLTTNHTFFMREVEHFTYFRQVVLPWLKKKEEHSKDLRIWCGASSTGEEPYTLAMVTMDFFGYSFETAGRFWNLALRMYLGTEDEAVCQSVAEKAMIIGYTRMLRRAIRRPNEADSPAKIARCKEMLEMLLNKVDSIDF